MLYERTEQFSGACFCCCYERIYHCWTRAKEDILYLLHVYCKGGSITCEVVAVRRYSEDLPQGGLEIPCLMNF